MMTTVVYWLPFAAMIVVFAGCFRLVRLIDVVNDRIAREAEILSALDVHLAQASQHARDHAEALMLWNHGAREEAIELLSKWGTRVHVA